MAKPGRPVYALDRGGLEGEDPADNPRGGVMSRLMADCRRWPSETNCSLVIIGEEEEIVQAAAEHAASVHGHEDTPELREQLRGMLEPAETYSPDPRPQGTLSL
jgi:hypothetical protein